jgi:hypothetical protein
MNLQCGRIGVGLCLLLISGDVHGSGKRNYRFDGKISREVLENYLSRSITSRQTAGNLGSSYLHATLTNIRRVFSDG